MYGGVNLPRHAKSEGGRRVNKGRCVTKKGVSQRDARYARNNNLNLFLEHR